MHRSLLKIPFYLGTFHGGRGSYHYFIFPFKICFWFIWVEIFEKGDGNDGEPDALEKLEMEKGQKLVGIKNCGWLRSYLKNIQSDLPNEARGQSCPWRSHDHSVKWYQIKSRGNPKYLNAYPRPNIPKKVSIRGQRPETVIMVK